MSLLWKLRRIASVVRKCSKISLTSPGPKSSPKTSGWNSPMQRWLISVALAKLRLRRKTPSSSVAVETLLRSMLASVSFVIRSKKPILNSIVRNSKNAWQNLPVALLSSMLVLLRKSKWKSVSSALKTLSPQLAPVLKKAWLPVVVPHTSTS